MINNAISGLAMMPSFHTSLETTARATASDQLIGQFNAGVEAGLSGEINRSAQAAPRALEGGAVQLAANDAKGEFSNVFVFGDSLSDIGNLHAVQPNRPERFTNGPVLAELVAQQVGVELTPSYHLLPPGSAENGNNFAVAGAVAIDNDGDLSTPDINLPTQVNAYLQLHGGQADPDAMHMVMIGGNDLFAAQDMILNGEWGSYFKAIDRLDQAANTVEQQLRTLVASGARHIVVGNAPDIGATPSTDIKAANVLENADSLRDYLVGGLAEGLSRHLTQVYNAKLAQAVRNVERDTGVDIQEYDLFGELDYILDNYQELGYENSTEFCGQNGEDPADCDINAHVFWDGVHPSAATHQLAAEQFFDHLV